MSEGVCIIALAVTPALQGQSQDAPKFHSGIDLINVTATVTDGEGRFVANLRREDFSVYEDGKRQTLTQFRRERVPVSLGILLDADALCQITDDTGGRSEAVRGAAALDAAIAA